MSANIYPHAVFCQSSKYFRKTIGLPGPTHFEQGQSIKQIPGGEYLMASNNGNIFSPYVSFFVKLNSYGNIISQVSFADTTVNSVLLDLKLSSNSAIVGGWYRRFNPDEQYHLLMKTDQNGDSIWTRIMMPDTSTNSGSYVVQNTLQGGYVFAGYKESPVTGYWDTNVVLTDSLGIKIWDNVYPENLIDVAYSIIQMQDSSFIVAGNQGLVLGNGDGYLMKLSRTGSLLWRKGYSMPGDSSTGITAVRQTNDHNYLATGVSSYILNFPYNPFLLKTDTAGNEIWKKKIVDLNGQFLVGSLDKIFILPDGDIVGCGSMLPNPFALTLRMTLLKTDSLGNLKWIRFITPDFNYDCYGYDMDTTSDGGFVICGRRDTMNSSDIYVVKTNCLGFYNIPVANFSVTWNGATAIFDNLSVRADTCIYYFGDGDSAVVQLTDTIPLSHTYSGPGPYQTFLVALACGDTDTLYQTIYTGINDSFNDLKRGFTIHPNPADMSITINYILPAFTKNTHFEIIDFSGREFFNKEIKPGNREEILDISFLPQGSFMVCLVVDDNLFFKRKLFVIR